jgi:hypothetical protein
LSLMDGEVLISEAAQRISVSSGCLRLLEWEEKVAPAPAPLLADIPRTGLGDPKEKPAGPKNKRECGKEYRGEVRICNGRKQPV